MKKILINFFWFFSFIAVLSGCAAGNTYVANDKDLVIEDFSNIHVGMSEQQVIETLGLPLSFGFNEEGRFLHYAEIHTTSVAGVIVLPLAAGGVNSTVIKGFESFIYFDENLKVKNVQIKKWQD